MGDDFRDRLLPGENIIWWGQPRGGFLFTSRDLFLVPFSLLWTGIVGYSNIAVFNTNRAQTPPPMFSLFSAAFLAIGIYLVIGRFFLDMWIRSKLRYAVTNRRVLILRLSPMQSFTAIELSRLPQMQLLEKSDGRGSIVFGEQAPVWSNRGFGAWTPSTSSTPQFLLIDDVKRVFDKIQELAHPAA